MKDDNYYKGKGWPPASKRIKDIVESRRGKLLNGQPLSPLCGTCISSFRCFTHLAQEQSVGKFIHRRFYIPLAAELKFSRYKYKYPLFLVRFIKDLFK